MRFFVGLSPLAAVRISGIEREGFTFCLSWRPTSLFHKKSAEPKPGKEALLCIHNYTYVYATRDNGEDIPRNKSSS
jgi:hypothetical protein